MESDSELPGQVRELRDFWFGNAAFDAAQDEPGTWVSVYPLRPLEAVAMFAGLPFRPLQEPFDLLFDAASGRFVACPVSWMTARRRSTFWRNRPAWWNYLIRPVLGFGLTGWQAAAIAFLLFQQCM
ncbi:MAG TPA: hypothetical protein VD862_01585 [Candidatus Paceibacterota bacterium]|nr:hypothetical protein [Candidatus Paceibacterota bacterium]